MNDGRLVAVVTGASSGIGSEITASLVRSGMRVYGCARTSDDSRIAHVDIRVPENVLRWADLIAEREPHVDILINNAGTIGERTPFAVSRIDEWADVITTNILGTAFVTHAFLPLLGQRRYSTIVNIGSIQGRFGRAGFTAYATSKFAIEGFTQALAQEVFHKHIRVVAVHPPRINTSLRRRAYGDEDPFPPENLNAVVSAIQWIANNPSEPISAMSLAADDLAAWGAAQ